MVHQAVVAVRNSFAYRQHTVSVNHTRSSTCLGGRAPNLQVCGAPRWGGAVAAAMSCGDCGMLWGRADQGHTPREALCTAKQTLATVLTLHDAARKYGATRWGGMVASAVSRGKKPVDAVVGELTEDTALEEAQFRELLEKIDRGLRALPATAQVGAPTRWAHSSGCPGI